MAVAYIEKAAREELQGCVTSPIVHVEMTKAWLVRYTRWQNAPLFPGSIWDKAVPRVIDRLLFPGDIIEGRAFYNDKEDGLLAYFFDTPIFIPQTAYKLAP
jgi:hypothetical protein